MPVRNPTTAATSTVRHGSACPFGCSCTAACVSSNQVPMSARESAAGTARSSAENRCNEGMRALLAAGAHADGAGCAGALAQMAKRQLGKWVGDVATTAAASPPAEKPSTPSYWPEAQCDRSASNGAVSSASSPYQPRRDALPSSVGSSIGPSTKLSSASCSLTSCAARREMRSRKSWPVCC